tara:strand:- start:215 stop:385 length:171 start_codon:yes stop_codon:yes gene_type:complete
MIVTSAKYVLGQGNENQSITAVIDNVTWSVPIEPDNAHYQAIQEWVAEGNKIEDAD